MRSRTGHSVDLQQGRIVGHEAPSHVKRSAAGRAANKTPIEATTPNLPAKHVEHVTAPTGCIAKIKVTDHPAAILRRQIPGTFLRQVTDRLVQYQTAVRTDVYRRLCHTTAKAGFNRQFQENSASLNGGTGAA